MRLEIGGVNYTAAPFNGWYMGTEIGARNFGDASRYNILPVLAEKMGLDTRSERSLWIDRALLEMNAAVIHSFAMAKVSLVDHHMAARHFMRHIGREEKAQRAITGQWNWTADCGAARSAGRFRIVTQERDGDFSGAFSNASPGDTGTIARMTGGEPDPW